MVRNKVEKSKDAVETSPEDMTEEELTQSIRDLREEKRKVSEELDKRIRAYANLTGIIMKGE